MESNNSPNYVLLATAATCGVCLGWFLRGRFRIPKNLPILATSDEGCIFSDSGNYKMVVVVRTDLKMGKGKVAAQVAHAAVSAFKQATVKNKAMLRKWEMAGQPKVVVKTETEESLLDIAAQAKKAGLIVSVIRDAGRTQIEAGSMTVVGVGPGPIEAIDDVTGHLKLC